MIISPWILLFCAIPVLLMGEKLVSNVSALRRFNIPAPVVGGLVVAIILFAVNLTGYAVRFNGDTRQTVWNWFVLTHSQLSGNVPTGIARIFLVGFFACIGLNASWTLLKRASWQLPLFLALAGVLTIFQNIIGVSIAIALNKSPLLGLLCGSVSLTGGHGTAISFSKDMVDAGFAAAPVVGVASATFGLIAAGLLGGPVGGAIIKKKKLKSFSENKDLRLEQPASQFSSKKEAEHGSTAASHADHAQAEGFIPDLRRLFVSNRLSSVIVHVFVVLLAIKLGAYVSEWINSAKIELPTFGIPGLKKSTLTVPIYIGAMIVGVSTRNILDTINQKILSTSCVEQLSSICLGIFLSVAMMELNIFDLFDAASAMLVILSAQVFMMAIFARYVTYNVMGKDYDAAVMAAGHCGFGLGATPAAVANMKAVAGQYGPAPRAFLIVPLVGCFFIDFINSMVIAIFLGLFGK